MSGLKECIAMLSDEEAKKNIAILREAVRTVKDNDAALVAMDHSHGYRNSKLYDTNQEFIRFLEKRIKELETPRWAGPKDPKEGERADFTRRG